MNIRSLTIDRDEALQKWAAYRAVPAARRGADDAEMELIYAALTRHDKPLLNLYAAFRQTGLDEANRPRLAIARAHWREVWFHPRPTWGEAGRCGFNPARTWNHRATRQHIWLPRNVFEQSLAQDKVLRSAVPHVPPEIRPLHRLENYFVLFEVAAWEAYPRDPFLLRQVVGAIYLVMAEWELTELEAALLTALRET